MDEHGVAVSDSATALARSVTATDHCVARLPVKSTGTGRNAILQSAHNDGVTTLH